MNIENERKKKPLTLKLLLKCKMNETFGPESVGHSVVQQYRL